MAAARAVGILLASIAAAQERDVPEVDWRSRAQVGREVTYGWKLEEWSMSPQGGGNGFLEHGTLQDRVYSEEAGDFLGVRLITRTNGGRTRTELRFFRIVPGGELVDDAPLESFCWESPEARDDFPHHDPIGARVDLVPGLTRERTVEILDPLFHRVFPDPVPVRETVTATIPRSSRELFPEPEELQPWVDANPGSMNATLERSWQSSDDQGLPSASGDVRLLSLRDTSTFVPATGLLVERELEFSYVRKEYPMIQRKRRVMEVMDEALFDELPPFLRSSTLALREAYRIARTAPREACRRLTEWARTGSSHDEDIAAQIWRITARAEKECWLALGEARRRGPAADASLAVSDDDAFEALRRGRLSALFTRLGLDGTRHRSAYQAALERRGLDPALAALLMRVHDCWPGTDDRAIPEPQRSEGSRLFEDALRELAGAR